MKKTILAMIALTAALTFSAPAKAQYHGTEACNSGTVSHNGVIDSARGSGPNGEKVVRFNIWFSNYTPKDADSVRRDLPDAIVGVMNQYAAEKGYRSRFVATDFAAPQNLNLTDYIDISSNADGSYEIYSYVNGWGEGHLFKFHSVSSSSLVDVMRDAAEGFVDRIATGWTCGTQN